MIESEARRPEFSGGVPIRLADGQEWHFPVPNVAMCPVFVDGVPRMGSATDFGPEFDAMVQAVADAESGPAELLAIWALAAAMLRRNYAIPDAALSGLLRHRWADEATTATIRAIIDVASGNAPKPSPVGDA